VPVTASSSQLYNSPPKGLQPLEDPHQSTGKEQGGKEEGGAEEKSKEQTVAERNCYTLTLVFCATDCLAKGTECKLW